jgi:hypothetical protein
VKGLSSAFLFLVKAHILTRKERWGLSGLGWVLLISVLFLTLFLTAVTIYPFLAITQRVDADILVVEGWVHEFGIRATLAEFKTGRYRYVFTTGGPRPGSDSSDPDTAASVMADWLHYRGIPYEFLRAVPSHVIGRDRTFHSAIALRNWLREHNSSAHSMNVISEMTHARRTRLLYVKAFGSDVKVGIISARNHDYDPKRWWRSSDGVREVIGEAVAYIYARLFFYPVKPAS